MVPALVLAGAGGGAFHNSASSLVRPNFDQFESEWRLLQQHCSWYQKRLTDKAAAAGAEEEEKQGVAVEGEVERRSRVEAIRRIQLWHHRPLDLQVPSSSSGSGRGRRRLLRLEVEERRRSGLLPCLIISTSTSTSSRGKPTMVIRSRSGHLVTVGSSSGLEAGEADRSSKRLRSSKGKEEEEEEEEKPGPSSNVDEKTEILKDLERQPSVSRSRWWVQLRVALGAALAFIPFLLPFEDARVEVPTYPEGPTFQWEGWGTSLCWWANFVGGLPEVDRDYVLDLIFDEKKGLGLNIARYNVGGGADLKFDTNMRPFADIPGYKAGPDAPYDWAADERQRQVLLGAKARGVNLFEAFSNSPPPWMTYSGSVTGNWKGGQDNLRLEELSTFADYLTDVVQEFERRWGIHFDYLAPFNEPVEGFWTLDRKKAAQEGCNFSYLSLAKVITEVQKCLSSKGLSTEISAADAWSLNTHRLMGSLGRRAMEAVSQINVHTYVPFAQREGDARRSEARDAVKAFGKKLWMSEYGPLNWSGTEMEIALGVGRHITLDINELQATAWCYWQVLEIPGKNFYWGLLHAEFKYDLDKSDPFRVQLKKQYYVMMQFTRWIRPGFTIIPMSEGQFQDWLVMAVDPTMKATVVLVFTNTSEREINVGFDVSGIAPGLTGTAVQAASFRTSDIENHKELPVKNFSKPVISLRIVPRSITTFIVSRADIDLSLPVSIRMNPL